MLVKTAVCEDAVICQKCRKYHAPNVDCDKVFAVASDESLSSQVVEGESINKNSDSDATNLGIKGVNDAQ